MHFLVKGAKRGPGDNTLEQSPWKDSARVDGKHLKGKRGGLFKIVISKSLLNLKKTKLELKNK